MEKYFKDIEEKDLPKVAEEVASFLEDFFKKENKACIIFLIGDLGAGKTTFTKTISKFLNEKEDVISPTFVLRKDYERFIHIDGYRFEKEEEAKALALELEVNKKGQAIFIEWPERFASFYNLEPDINIVFSHKNEDTRDISINFR
ncbi:MAG: tRNA ((37)-N6)-threonylcarbamoyltransferase complex ATPase subunit type 1 TsaE [Candidatus Parcubacteria bacterium]|jgi:tRNA threonylcarbamoyladenosine biosynthesis protein TsaE